MANKIASTLFKTQPTQDLLTVDSYKAKSNLTLNSIPDILNNYGVEAAQAIQRNPKIAQNIVNAIVRAKDGKITPVQMLDRVTKSLGSAGVIRNLTKSLQGSIISGMGGLGISKENSGKILGVVKGGIGSYLSGDLDNIRGISELARQVTGTSDIFQVFDLAAEAAVVTTVLDYSIQAGAVDLFDEILANTKDQSVRHIALRNSVKATINYSDLVTLNKIVDQGGVGLVFSQNPAPVKAILSSYRFPRGTKESDHPDLYTSLKTTIERIDPNWATYNRNGEEIPNLESFTYASSDALLLFMKDPFYSVQAMIAPNHKSSHLVELVRRNYPKAYIS